MIKDKTQLKEIFFIDFENIGCSGVNELVEKIKNKSIEKIIIFYSDNNKSISMDVVDKLLKTNANIELSKVKVGGKNALDFQLSSYLGYLIKQYEDTVNYRIVSNDKGFNYVVSFWNAFNVERIDIKPQKPTQPVQNNKPQPNILVVEELQGLLPDSNVQKVVLKIFNQCKTRTEIANQIQKHYRNSSKTGQIYKKLKPLLKKYNK